MSVEKQMSQIEEEIKAIKDSFEQSASSMKIYTNETTYQTKANTMRISNSGTYNPLQWSRIISIPQDVYGNWFGPEIVVVTFDCPAGNNTFASLELSKEPLAALDSTSVRRVPYAGGAKWLIEVQPNVDSDPDHSSYYLWNPTTLNIAIQSASEGVIGVKMIWE